METFDEISEALRALRTAAGHPSFSELVRRIEVARTARGVPQGERRPGRITVYDCFRAGRCRLDVELVADIVRVLGETEEQASRWRLACQRATARQEILGLGQPVSDLSQPAGTAHALSVTTARITAALRLLDGAGIVNVVGPVGIGKTSLLAAYRPGDILFDPADSFADVAEVEANAAALLIVASRRPLLSRAGWAGRRVVTVQVEAWSDEDIRQFATRAGITDPARRDLVARLAGGIPLIAEHACHALHLGALEPGAVADRATTEIVSRLSTEHTPVRAELLAHLASSGAGDQDLLTRAEFDELGALSLVVPAAHGLAVLEPYRTLFDLAHRWRTPAKHLRAVQRATTHRRGFLMNTAGPRRDGLVEQALWLTGDPTIREALFPSRPEVTTVRPSVAGDAEDILRLTRHWVDRGGLDRGRSERIVAGWLRAAPAGFRVAVDRDGKTVGTISSVPFTGHTISVIEPLLQPQTPRFAGQGGVFIGMAYSADGPAHAALLRDAVVAGMDAGGVVVATFWPAYQKLVRAMGFRHHGDSVDDVYRCGRPLQVHARDMAGESLPAWLDRLSALGLYRPASEWLTHQVRQTLRHLQETASPAAVLLRHRVRQKLEELAASPDPQRAAAGALLISHYLRGEISHLMGVSRATYYRRLRQAAQTLASSLAQDLE